MSAPGTGEQCGANADADAGLWRAFKESGSATAREQLFNHYANFARKIARRHYNERSQGDIEFADLCQLSYAGLLEALDHYDPDRGVPFRAFAAYRISGSVRDGIGQMNEVRDQISSRAQTRRERLRSLSESGELEGGDAIQRLTEIAMGLALGFMLEGTGLYAQSDDEVASAAPTGTAYDGLAWCETVAHLHDELLALPEREQTILRHHYIGGVSFENIASAMGVTKGRVSQIHRSALQLLQKRMHRRGHFKLER
jgi:RNA polymerase sigma factor for flagellar operon FliA